jgi:flavin-dependent dehydrogenase
MTESSTYTPDFRPAEGSGEIFDLVVVGGGLGGLTLAIQMARLNYRVALFEKEEYPFHRVCGEYISFECWNFLENLGFPLSDMDLPVIKQLLLSAPDGKILRHPLTLGGFGISRYSIDAGLAQIAREEGVQLFEGEKVTDLVYVKDRFVANTSRRQVVVARCAVAAYGKRSNLDIRWKRSFAMKRPGKLNNFIGVKYHIYWEGDEDTIALHNFEDGYCGMSKVDHGMYCLCYLSTAAQLKKYGSIPELEKQVLYKNPHLARIFTEAKFVRKEPVTISQIAFTQKQQVEQHVLMIGDAAGVISPLCGNGMSMAMHAGKLATEQMDAFLKGSISRQQMEENYRAQWRRWFGRRLRTGRMIQRFFGKPVVTNLFISLIQPFPRFIASLIRQTHGEPF